MSDSIRWVLILTLKATAGETNALIFVCALITTSY